MPSNPLIESLELLEAFIMVKFYIKFLFPSRKVVLESLTSDLILLESQLLTHYLN